MVSCTIFVSTSSFPRPISLINHFVWGFAWWRSYRWLNHYLNRYIVLVFLSNESDYIYGFLERYSENEYTVQTMFSFWIYLALDSVCHPLKRNIKQNLILSCSRTYLNLVFWCTVLKESRVVSKFISSFLIPNISKKHYSKTFPFFWCLIEILGEISVISIKMQF